MKYRILEDEKGYRAQVELESRRTGQKYFEYIEEDGNLNSISITKYHNTKQEAIKENKKHHLDKGYDKLPKVVEEFEL